MGSGLQGDGRGLWHDLPEGIEKTGMVEGVDRQVCRGVYFLIYSYHMPAFFFVSGWLWREMGFADFIRKRTRRLLIPYLLVGLVSIVIFAMAGGAQGMHVGVEGGYLSANR